MQHTNSLGPIMRRHPLTGAAIVPLGVVGGRVVWPIMGGDETAGAAATGTEGAAAAGAAGTEGDPGASGGAQGATKTDEGGSDKGFPAHTPVADMTPEQQAAYHLHQSRKHEDRAKGWASAFPGKTAAEIKAIVDKAEADRRKTLTVDEAALEDAKNQGRTEVRTQLAPVRVREAFELVLGDTPKAEIDAALDLLDLNKFVNDDGRVDTAKVRTFAQKINPAMGSTTKRPIGQGSRGGGHAAGSVAAVMAERRAARESKSK